MRNSLAFTQKFLGQNRHMAAEKFVEKDKKMVKP